jgi:hypothetical protein
MWGREESLKVLYQFACVLWTQPSLSLSSPLCHSLPSLSHSLSLAHIHSFTHAHTYSTFAASTIPLYPSQDAAVLKAATHIDPWILWWLQYKWSCCIYPFSLSSDERERERLHVAMFVRPPYRPHTLQAGRWKDPKATGHYTLNTAPASTCNQQLICWGLGLASPAACIIKWSKLYRHFHARSCKHEENTETSNTCTHTWLCVLHIYRQCVFPSLLSPSSSHPVLV